MSLQYSIGDVLDVRVEKIVPRGLGLAFAEKLTVLIPLAAPGDELRVRIREIKKRLAFAEIVEIKQPGPDRAVPPCKYFGACGGCDFQQLTYSAQLAAKVAIIRDCLHRITKIDYAGDIPIIASPQPLGYRSRARWHLDGSTRAFGYFRRDSHDVIDVESCPILTGELGATLERVRANIDREPADEGLSEIEAATGDDGSVSTFSYNNSGPAADIAFSTNSDVYHFSAMAFFQANKLLIGELIDAAITGAEGEMAFDLYAGVGLFSLPMARQFTHVLAVEEYPAAVEYAKRNVAEAGIDNVKVIAKGVERFLYENKTRDVDLVLIDPPRSGTEKHTIPSIAELKPFQISYVSCEPSILARDLSLLLNAGYKIDRITALDLFPQTHHVETVARLSLA